MFAFLLGHKVPDSFTACPNNSASDRKKIIKKGVAAINICGPQG